MLAIDLTEVHSIMKFAVQVTVHFDFKSYHCILYDLQRNYDNIATNDLQRNYENIATIVYCMISNGTMKTLLSQYNVWSPTELWKHCYHSILYTDHNSKGYYLLSMHRHVVWYITYHRCMFMLKLHDTSPIMWCVIYHRYIYISCLLSSFVVLKWGDSLLQITSTTSTLCRVR
jgi:hypothetical protein